MAALMRPIGLPHRRAHRHAKASGRQPVRAACASRVIDAGTSWLRETHALHHVIERLMA